MVSLMTSKNYPNILMVQLFLLHFVFHLLQYQQKVCFVFKWRSSIIISHICIINHRICFKTPSTSRSIRIVVTTFNQIVHRHSNINKICIIIKSIINFCSAVFKWCIIFKCYICSYSKWFFSLKRIITCSNNSSCNGNISSN